MASAENNMVTGNFTGTLGKQLVFRDWKGKTVVAKPPKRRKGEPNAQQRARQEKFLIATRYAKAITTSADKSMADGYARALKSRQNIFSRAVEDFLSPPVVVQIDTSNYTGEIGDKIVVRAYDDFRIIKLRVEIRDVNGHLLESGLAELNMNGIDWTYTAKVVNNPSAESKVKAIATDVPGNEGVLEITL